MTRRNNTKSSIYTYLRAQGILESGTHEEIQNARKEYWKGYKRKWRNEKRKKEKEFALSLNKDELKEISIEAKRHKLSRTQFIKQSCFSYINKSYIVPGVFEVRQISQLLSMTYNSIQEMLVEDNLEYKLGRELMESIQNLERQILPKLKNPKSLNEIIQDHILANPENKQRLSDFIESL